MSTTAAWRPQPSGGLRLPAELVCDESMDHFIAQHADTLQGTLSCFDRVLFTAFNPVTRPDSQLFIALMSGEHAVHGFANRDLRAKLAATSVGLNDDPRRQSAQVSRLSTVSTDLSRRFPGLGAGG
jgi:hypothetical protein